MKYNFFCARKNGTFLIKHPLLVLLFLSLFFCNTSLAKSVHSVLYINGYHISSHEIALLSNILKDNSQIKYSLSPIHEMYSHLSDENYVLEIIKAKNILEKYLYDQSTALPPRNNDVRSFYIKKTREQYPYLKNDQIAWLADFYKTLGSVFFVFNHSVYNKTKELYQKEPLLFPYIKIYTAYSTNKNDLKEYRELILAIEDEEEFLSFSQSRPISHQEYFLPLSFFSREKREKVVESLDDEKFFVTDIKNFAQLSESGTLFSFHIVTQKEDWHAYKRILLHNFSYKGSMSFIKNNIQKICNREPSIPIKTIKMDWISTYDMPQYLFGMKIFDVKEEDGSFITICAAAPSSENEYLADEEETFRGFLHFVIDQYEN